MDKTLTPPDWALLQVFLVVAETGSLSAAARAMGQSQPTLGRQVRKLEVLLGAELFRRQPRGLSLTEDGMQLLPAAQRMAEAAGQLAMTVAGRDDQLAGTIRITASEIVAFHILPRILAELRSEVPQLQIELVASDMTESLTFREADIALRMYRPEQLDIVTRKLGDVPMSAFAAKSYLDRVGRPRTLQEALGHDMIGYDRSELMLRAVRGMGIELSREDFALRCDHQLTNWELVRAGAGIGFGQAALGRADPLLEELDLGLEIPGLPVWLSAHEGIRRTPRVSLVWDRLTEGLAPFVS